MENTKNKLRNLLEKMLDNPDENGCYFVDYWDENEENPFEWKAVINGPIGTPYEGGYYKLKLIFDQKFPITGPKIKFVTTIYHCNISNEGLICLNLIKNWKENYTIPQVLKSVYQMLAVQNPNDAYSNEDGVNKGTEYLTNRSEFDRKARLFRDKYARLNQL